MQTVLNRHNYAPLRVRDHLGVAPVRPPTVRNIYTCKGLVQTNKNFGLRNDATDHNRVAIKVQAAANFGDSSEIPAQEAATEGRSTFIQAVFNVVNVMMGVGLLSLPFALKSSGWIGIGLLWLMGIVTNNTGKAADTI